MSSWPSYSRCACCCRELFLLTKFCVCLSYQLEFAWVHITMFYTIISSLHCLICACLSCVLGSSNSAGLANVWLLHRHQRMSCTEPQRGWHKTFTDTRQGCQWCSPTDPNKLQTCSTDVILTLLQPTNSSITGMHLTPVGSMSRINSCVTVFLLYHTLPPHLSLYV